MKFTNRINCQMTMNRTLRQVGVHDLSVSNPTALNFALFLAVSRRQRTKTTRKTMATMRGRVGIGKVRECAGVGLRKFRRVRLNCACCLAKLLLLVSVHKLRLSYVAVVFDQVVITQ
jgi:hypothetical protein